MPHTDSPWTRLAARTARGLLARKGRTYQDVADALQRMGIPETPRGVESKIQRGSFQFSFLLQLLTALDAEYPQQWRQLLESNLAWEVIARQIVLHELTSHGLDYKKLSLRLGKHGIPAENIESQLSGGTFQFTLVLQLSLALPIPEFERYVDRKDVAATAAEALEH